MDIMDALQKVFDTALIPAIMGACAYIIALGKKYAKKWADQMEAKHELDNMAKRSELKNTLLKEIKTIVDSVVGSNMQLADAKKMENGGKLTDSQSADIRLAAEEVIMASLPESLTSEDGVLLKVIGGSDRLHIIIDSMIDQAVYDYKLKKK